MIVTTTDSIEGATVQKYLGLVASNLVIGTNVISDFIASFSDFFGGMSGQYKNQLNVLYERAVEDLTQKAIFKGANAVLGAKLDFDEISGKGKSMFMVSITGTAVKCQYGNDSKEDDVIVPNKYISRDELSKAHFLDQWNRSNVRYVTNEEWDFILTHDLPEIAEDLLEARMRYNSEDFDPKLNEYLNKLDSETRLNAVYNAYYSFDDSSPLFKQSVDSFFYKLIDQYSLFCPYQITKLLKAGNVHFAIRLLNISKPFYSKEDLNEMESHIQFLEDLPDTGSVKEANSSRFNSETKKVYVCQNGHENNITNEFCRIPICGCNIKGLVEKEVKQISEYKEIVAALRGLLEASDN